MALRYPGGFISSTAPTVNANTAKGVWTLEEAMQYIKAGQWPVPTGNGDPYFQYNSILLPGQGTNGANNNTFLDSSTNNFTITRNGNTTQGTFTPFSQASGYWANYLGTTGNYFYLNGESGFAFGSSADFTIEFFFYANSFGGDVVFYDSRPTSTNGVYATLYYNNSSKVISYVVSSADRITGTSVISTSQWHHVVLTRLSGNTKLFVDGVQQGSTYADTNNYLNPSGRPTVCASGFSATGYLDGYISNFRVLNGTGFTSVTVPTSPFAVNTTNQILLIASSNRFIDANTATTAKTVNVGGSPQVTPFEPFGAPTSAYSASTVGGSGYFDGSGDYLTAANNSAFLFGTGDFTVEAWVYPTALNGASNNTIACVWSASQTAWFLGINNASSVLFAYGSGGSSASSTFSYTFTTNQWYHIAVTRSGTSLKAFVNGVQAGSTVTNSTNITSTAVLAVGANMDGGPTQYWNGYVTDCRLVKGTAVYTSAFTPPTAPLTAITNTSLLLSGTNAGIIDNAEKNDLETVGNAQISTSQYKFGTSSMYFDGTGDWLIVDGGSPNYIFGTGDFTIEMWINPSTVSPSYQGIWDSRTADPSVTPHITLASGAPVWWVSGAARITGSTLSASTWYHLAVSRTGGSTKMFVNGNQVGSTYADTNNYTSRSLPTIGVNFDGLYPFTGYLQDLRITKGYARYPYNFTAPTAAFPLFYQAAATPSADPYFENTTLLLPGNGTNGAQNNTFLDSSTNAFTITRNGNTTQGTFTPFSQTGWGNYFDGSGDTLLTQSTTAFNLSTNPFCIEMWFYWTGSGSSYYGLCGSASDYKIALCIYQQKIMYGVSSTGSSWDILKADVTSPGLGSTTIYPNTWYHLVLCRTGNTFSGFVNGVRDITTTSSAAVVSRTEGYGIGSWFGAYYYALGYISNFRFVVGSNPYDATQTTLTVPTAPLTAITNTQLLTCQSNRFADNSSNAFAITVNGPPNVQAFSPFNPTASYSTSTVGGSGYFDGSGDYLTVPYSSQLQFTGDFTIEFWAYPLTQVSSFAGVVNNYSSWPSSTGFAIFCGHSSGSATKWNVALFGTFPAITSTNDFIKNAWSHIALVRSGTGSNNITLYVNGVASGTATSNNTVTGTADNWWIGATGDGPTTQNFTGYLSNFRAINSAVYTGAFTPPTAPLVAGSSKLLLSCTNGGITDATAKNDLETVGGASISTTQSKFGGSSMYFDGSGDYLYEPSNQNYNFGSGDFTIELWMRLNANPVGGDAGIVDLRPTSVQGNYFMLGINTSNQLFVYVNSAARIGYNSTTVISTGTWYHIAYAKYGTTGVLYVNGVALGSWTDNTTYLVSPCTIAHHQGGQSDLNGYINDLRITKGIARYTTNFTPPTTAFLTL